MLRYMQGWAIYWTLLFLLCFLAFCWPAIPKFLMLLVLFMSLFYGLVYCSVWNAAVLCENCRESIAQFWTSLSEEEGVGGGDKILTIRWLSDCPVTFWFGTLAKLFHAVVHQESTWRWMARCYKGLYVTVSEILRDFLCIIVYCLFTLSLHVESADSMTW